MQATPLRTHSHSNRSTFPSPKTRMRRPDATHSDPQAHNTFDAAVRAYTMETRLKASGRMVGHTQVRTIFWLRVQTFYLRMMSASGVLGILGELLEAALELRVMRAEGFQAISQLHIGAPRS
jgi:hypothetical protein